MTGSFDRDPFDELRRANPVDTDRLPPASLARVRARVQEATNVESEEQGLGRRRWSRVPAWAAGLGAAGLAAVVVAAIVVGRGGSPVVPLGPSTGPGVAMCVEQYSLETLKHRGFAFEGTVTSISGNEVTFAVGERYRGAGGGTVTLTATGMTATAITSAGGPTLTVGERYLVAGDGHFVWACGFTQRYDAGVARQWKQATAGS